MRNKNYFFMMLLVTAFLFLGCQNENPISTSESDSLFKSKPVTGGTCEFDLSPEEEDGLIHMRLEEKVARDVYIFLGDFYNRQLFTNISESEQIHMDKMLALLIKYDVEDPASNEVGVFYQPEIQQLYDAFILQGQISYSEALLVGKAIEELDISDLGFQLTFVDNPDIVNVYTNLLAASQNHLATFLSHINTDTPKLPSTE
jgi:hypothetical protein